MDKIYPVENATVPYWRSQLHEIDSYQSTEGLPEECDIVIIGAGLSGVSTAYWLLDDNPNPPSIVLLEARQICSGATGRNGSLSISLLRDVSLADRNTGGHLMMVYPYIEEVTKEHGADAARELLLFQKAQVSAMKRTAEKEELDCDLVLTRVCEATLSQETADERRAVYDENRRAGLDYIDDVDFVGPKYAENVSCVNSCPLKHPILVMMSDTLQISGVKGAKAAITVTAAQLWPYKFVTGLLAKLIKRTSINVRTHTRVTSVLPDRDGRHVVSTPRGAIRAQKVVFATNAYTSGVAPEYCQKIVPRKGSCSHIRVPKNTLHQPPHLTHTYGLSYSNGHRDYLIPRPDNGVICGGGKHTYGDQTELWFNNWDDSTVIEATRKHFATVMQENFVGWERSGAEVDYLWSGSKCISFLEEDNGRFSNGS